MADVTVLPIKAHTKREDGFTMFDGEQPSLPFGPKDQSFNIFPPRVVGGNHSHPRSEAFLALTGGANFYWLDSNNNLQNVPLQPFSIVLVAPDVPHAVRNDSDEPVYIVEYASEKQHDVLSADIFKEKS